MFTADTEPPQVSCPPDIQQFIGPGQTSTTVTWNEENIIATDNSGTVTRRSRSHQPGDRFFIGPAEVTYEFVDPSNNVGSCTFLVTIDGK